MLKTRIVLVAGSLCLAGAGDSSGQSQRRPQQVGVKQPTTAITQPKSNEDQRGTEHAPIIVKVAPTQKTDTERAEEAKERERVADSERKKENSDADLVKYTGELASFTKYLFGATVALVGATIGLGVAAFFQSRDTKRAVVAAERSANAAALSAHAAVGVELPRLFVTQIETKLIAMNMMDQEPHQISITITNYGRTPAFLRYESAEFLPGPLPAAPIYPNAHDLEPGTILENGQLRTLTALGRDNLAQFEVRPFVTGQAMLWTYGVIRFRDFLNEPHEMRFCAELHVPKGRAAGNPPKFIQWGPTAYTESY